MTNFWFYVTMIYQDEKGRLVNTLLDEALKILESNFIEQHKRLNIWENTNRNHFMRLITKCRGDNAEKIIKTMCDSQSIPCILNGDNSLGYDAVINGKYVEIKYAGEGNTGGYMFNQIRPNADKYEYILFFFLGREDSRFYTIKRSDLKNFKLNEQHAGKETYTMSTTKENMIKLERCGDGTFIDAIKRIV